MTTTDNALLIILTSLLSILLLLGIAVVVGVLKLMGNVRQVIAKADEVVGSVEAAAEVLKDAQGRLAFFKLVRNIMKLVKRSRR